MFSNTVWTFWDVFFLFFIWIWILISILSDLFRRHDMSGWFKAVWVIGVIVLPYLGVLVYLIAYHTGMAERSAKQIAANQAQTDSYIRSVAGGPASEIASAQELLEKGTITQAEFDTIKAKALAKA